MGGRGSRSSSGGGSGNAGAGGGLPDLTGTERQVAWAESIRENAVQAVEKDIEDSGSDYRRRNDPNGWQYAVENARLAQAQLPKIDSASFYIDHRNSNFTTALLPSALNDLMGGTGRESRLTDRELIFEGGGRKVSVYVNGKTSFKVSWGSSSNTTPDTESYYSLNHVARDVKSYLAGGDPPRTERIPDPPVDTTRPRRRPGVRRRRPSGQ